MVILNLVNLIWNTGNFPKNWKIVIIIPIFKPDKYSLEPNKYIPISLTSCLGKLFKWQTVCWRKHSTADGLNLENEIHQAFLNREYLVAVSLWQNVEVFNSQTIRRFQRYFSFCPLRGSSTTGGPGYMTLFNLCVWDFRFVIVCRNKIEFVLLFST